MKTLIAVMVFAISTSAFAGECVNKKGEDIYNQPDVFQALIEQSASCFEAKGLAEACAYGSSLDVSSAGAAYAVCQKELAQQKPAATLNKTLANMVSLCNKKYRNEEGTMYRSMNAFCNLSAIEWILGLATPN